MARSIGYGVYGFGRFGDPWTITASGVATDVTGATASVATGSPYDVGTTWTANDLGIGAPASGTPITGASVAQNISAITAALTPLATTGITAYKAVSGQPGQPGVIMMPGGTTVARPGVITAAATGGTSTTVIALGVAAVLGTVALFIMFSGKKSATSSRKAKRRRRK